MKLKNQGEELIEVPARERASLLRDVLQVVDNGKGIRPDDFDMVRLLFARVGCRVERLFFHMRPRDPT